MSLPSSRGGITANLSFYLGIGVGEGSEGVGQGHTDQCGPDLTPYQSQCQGGGHPNRGEGVTVCAASSPDLF